MIFGAFILFSATGFLLPLHNTAQHPSEMAEKKLAGKRRTTEVHSWKQQAAFGRLKKNTVFAVFWRGWWKESGAMGARKFSVRKKMGKFFFRKKLTDNVHHILAPLLEFTLYKSSLLYASIVRTIRHFSLVTEKEFFDSVTALVVSNSLPIIVSVTQRCDAKSNNFRNICDDALICI